jgi:hypothetical protein
VASTLERLRRDGEARSDMSDQPAAAEQTQGRLERLERLASRLFFGAAALLMGLFAVSLLGAAGYQLLAAALRSEDLLHPTLESIGLITIAVAVFHVTRFLLEEEITGGRELRSVLESRRSLTMFFTIVIITLALEALVLVFGTKLEAMPDLIYPTALMAVAVLALVGLGAFQRLSAEGGSNLIGPDRGGGDTRPARPGG